MLTFPECETSLVWALWLSSAQIWTLVLQVLFSSLLHLGHCSSSQMLLLVVFPHSNFPNPPVFFLCLPGSQAMGSQCPLQVDSELLGGLTPSCLLQWDPCPVLWWWWHQDLWLQNLQFPKIPFSLLLGGCRISQALVLAQFSPSSSWTLPIGVVVPCQVSGWAGGAVCETQR